MAPELLELLLMGIVGLAIGSFLNVLIHRLPIMIEQSWLETTESTPALELHSPGSHCPSCKHSIGWIDKLPLIGFALLRGHCRHCGARISWQYPLIELLTCALFVWSLSVHPYWLQALAWAGFAATLLALAVIDARTTWLPDTLTQPLTWAGLVASAWGLTGVGLSTALWGAVAGYLSLWSIYWVFRLATGKEGMGYGDFKLLAALGAWFGWQALLPMALAASVGGLLYALVRKWMGIRSDKPEMPFGPFLALAGAWQLFWGLPHVMGV